MELNGLLHNVHFIENFIHVVFQMPISCMDNWFKVIQLGGQYGFRFLDGSEARLSGDTFN